MPQENGWATGPEHCDNDGRVCPYCGSENTDSGSLDTQAGQVVESGCECLDCGKTFGNLYNIAGWYDESGELHEDTQTADAGSKAREDVHTHGPWHYEAKEGEVHSLFGSICTVHGWDNPDDETVPNAELLASAPRLQEHVRILREALTEANKRIKALSPDGYIAPERWKIESALEATKEGT